VIDALTSSISRPVSTILSAASSTEYVSLPSPPGTRFSTRLASGEEFGTRMPQVRLS